MPASIKNSFVKSSEGDLFLKILYEHLVFIISSVFKLTKTSHAALSHHTGLLKCTATTIKF